MSSLRKIVGAVLWWAEGTKSRRDKRWKNAITYPLEMTSTDPSAIKIFLDFIRYDLKVDESKIKAQIQVHEKDDIRKLERNWSSICGIPLTRFNKTIIRPVGRKIGKSSGTCKIRLNNKEKYLEAKKILDEIVSGCSAAGSARRLGR